jgi:hypothetical protein
MESKLLKIQEDLTEEIKSRSHPVQSEFEKGAKHGLLIASRIVAEAAMKDGEVNGL